MSRHVFTPLEEHSMREWAGKIPGHEIALRLDIPKGIVDGKMRRMGLSYRVDDPDWESDKTIPHSFEEVNGKFVPIMDAKKTRGGIPKNINFLFYRGK